MSDEAFEAPQDEEAVAPVVAEYLPLFGQVLTEAWKAFTRSREAEGSSLGLASASSRGMLMSDLTREPAHRIFASQPRAHVEDRYVRPWVNLDGGNVQVRFRKLTTDLKLCRSDSDRAIRLAYHLGDPLPGIPVATILTAGYVLDEVELNLSRLTLVCHVGTEVYYSFPLPGGGVGVADPSRDASPAAPTPMPLMPLSPPIIRSARSAAVERLARRRAAGEPDGPHGNSGA